MAMFQYFKRVDGQYPGSKLPDPQGALAQEVPSRAISVANTEVALLQQAGGRIAQKLFRGSKFVTRA